MERQAVVKPTKANTESVLLLGHWKVGEPYKTCCHNAKVAVPFVDCTRFLLIEELSVFMFSLPEGSPIFDS